MSLAEESGGTNAVALALRLLESVYMQPGQYYCEFLNQWYCYAVPMRVGEKTVGCLAVTAVGQPLKDELIAVADLLGYRVVNELKKKLRVRLRLQMAV